MEITGKKNDTHMKRKGMERNWGELWKKMERLGW